MLLTVDIGNSNIAFGIYEQNWVRHWRLSTVANKTSDEYAIQFRSLLAEEKISPIAIQRVVMSSVVPPLTFVFQRMLRQLTQQEPLVINTSLNSGLTITTDNPHELGTDLLANAVAGYHLAQTACIIVDFGTALSITVVNQKREIAGVAIAPGLESALKALSSNTAQLPFVPLAVPPSVLGRNTVQAIQSGVMFGYLGLVEGLVSRIETELDTSAKVIATGGLAEIIAPMAEHSLTIEPWLTLDGLRLLSGLNQ
ncbi:MAG: type III pantothenate kinase [Bacteroidota bacterium]